MLMKILIYIRNKIQSNSFKGLFPRKRLCIVKIIRLMKFLQGNPQRFLRATNRSLLATRNALDRGPFFEVFIKYPLVDVFFAALHYFYSYYFILNLIDPKNNRLCRLYRILADFLVKFLHGFLFLIENYIENLRASYPNRIMEHPTIWQRLKGVKRYPLRFRLLEQVYQKFLVVVAFFYNKIIFNFVEKYNIFWYIKSLILLIFFLILALIVLFYGLIMSPFYFIVKYYKARNVNQKHIEFAFLSFYVVDSFLALFVLHSFIFCFLMLLWILRTIYNIADNVFVRVIAPFLILSITLFLEFVSDIFYYLLDLTPFLLGLALSFDYECLSYGAFAFFFLFTHIVQYNTFNLFFNKAFTQNKTRICFFVITFGFEFFYFLLFLFNVYCDIYMSFVCLCLISFIALWTAIRGFLHWYVVPDLRTIRYCLGFLFLILIMFLIEHLFFSELLQSFKNISILENNDQSLIYFYPTNWIPYINMKSIINPYIILFIFPLLFSFFILFLKNKETIKISALALSLLLFLYIIYLCIIFNNNKESLQFVYKGVFGISPLTYSFYFAFDGISLSLVLLTAFLIPLCLLTLNTIHDKIKEFIILLFITQVFLNIAFTTFNLLIFYVAFEAILIPMFILILIWGSRERKIRSVYLLFFYTLVGSVPFLLSICYLINIGSTDNIIYLNSSGYQLNIPFKVQEILCYCFTLSFAVKMPMFPIHIWLPEAHVEAPTSGSILLAGILLKLGGYGFFRFCLPLFSEAMQSISPLIIMLSLLGIFFIGIITLVQEDLKKIIAYSSVAHMNLVIIALFSNNLEAFQSSIVVMLSHGIVSGGLFYIIGALYNVSHTRSLFEHGGLAGVMPFFTFFFLTLTFANISLPGTVSFVGEFLIFQSIVNYSYLATLIAMTTVVFGAAYSLFLLCRLCYGNLKLQFISYYRDLILKDNIALIVICFLIIFFGINPKGITDLINAASFFY